MKRLTLLTTAFLITIGTFAATISGTVTNSSTSAPVAGQKMYLFNPRNSSIDSAVTNSSGVYSIPIPSSTVLYDSLKVFTFACGAQQAYYPWYSGSNITVNFSICVSVPPPPTYTIHGTISLSGIANNGLATVYLISKQYDTVAMDTVLTAIDSITTASTGGTYTKTYSANPLLNLAPGGSLLLKAALKPSHPNYWSYVPTYFSSALTWNGAIALSAANFNSANSTNINMTSGTNSGGVGFIGGQVLLGANKNAGVGDPLSKRILVLTNSAGIPLTYTFSDYAGQFSFPNLALGTYKIFGDAWGKLNPAFTVTVTATKPSISNITFEENSTSFKGHFGGLNVTSAELENVAIYPNPATDYIGFTGLSNISGSKSVVVTDIAGAIILRKTFLTGETVQFPVANFPEGMYQIQLLTEEGNAGFKFVR